MSYKVSKSESFMWRNSVKETSFAKRVERRFASDDFTCKILNQNRIKIKPERSEIRRIEIYSSAQDAHTEVTVHYSDSAITFYAKFDDVDSTIKTVFLAIDYFIKDVEADVRRLKVLKSQIIL